MRTCFGVVLAVVAPLALAQAPAHNEPKAAPPKAQKAPKAQNARRSQPPSKAHAKPTPDQIQKFNELQKQGGKS